MRQRKNTPAANLVADLVAVQFPRMAARRESMRLVAIEREIAAGRLTVEEARAQMRGAA